MKNLALSCLSAVLPALCAAALAQEPPPPAAELDKLDVLLGTWEVSGIGQQTPDGPEVPWTAVQTVRRVLGGHFLRDEMVIETAGPPLVFLSFMGWDAENERYVGYMASNMGIVTSAEMFINGNTFVNAAVNVMYGEPMTERAVLTVDGDRYSFSAEQSIGDGPFFTMTRGTGRRISRDADAQAIEATMSMVPPAPEMKVFEKMAGSYDVEGTMAPMPGAVGVADIAFTGTETIGLTMGGVILQQHETGTAEGSGHGFEAYRFVAWNARNKCYDLILVDNTGRGGKQQLRVLDDRTLVGTMSVLVAGQPTVGRTILKLDAEGGLSSLEAHMISGAAEPQRAFFATYTRQR